MSLLIEGISQYFKPGVLYGSTVTAPVLLLVVLLTALGYCFWWRSCESARASKFSRSASRSDAASSSLPRPAAVLPRWLGLVGGHTLQITSEQMVQQMEAWADELGGKFQLTVFGKRVVVVAGIDGVRHVLNKRPSIFRRGLTPTHFHWPAKKIGLLPALFFDEGKEWGRSRRLICPHLVGNNVADMIPALAKITERFCAQLGEKERAGEVVDGIHAFESFAHDSVALAAFGLHTDSMTASKDQPCPSLYCVKTVMQSFMTLMLQPLAMLGWVTLAWLLPWVKNTNKQSKLLRDMIQGAINKARLEHRKGIRIGSGLDGVKSIPDGVLLRKMAAVAERGNDGKQLPERMAFSDDEVVRQAMSLFIGGTGTTAFVLCWVMCYLTKHPKMLARCREEALRAAPERNGVASTREQVAKLEFCSAVFMETLRLRSSSTVLFFHNGEATTMEDGTMLEKNTGVIVLTRYAGVSEDCFTRPKDFVPERWIEAEREEALLGKGGNAKGDRSVKHDEKGFLAFGAGPRACPGKAVAKAQAGMIIAAMCARFDVALGPGQDDPPDEILTYGSGPRTARLVLTKTVTA